MTDKNRLYVGGLPYSTTDRELEEAFAAHGDVNSASVVTDRMTGRSRGFGFVEMSSEEEAQSAIDALDQTQMDGRSIKVNKAKPRENRGSFGGDGGRGRRGW